MNENLQYYARDPETLDRGIENLLTRAKAFWNWNEHPCAHITIRPAKRKRSLDQNALYWVWVERIHLGLTERGMTITKDETHALMRHKHLGYKTLTVNDEEVHILKSTAKLTVGEFTHYLEKLDAWAAELGIMLPTPDDCEKAGLTRYG